MKKIFKITISTLLSWFVIHCLFTVYDGLKNFSGKADVAIVPGSQVRKDGSLSPWTKGRVDKALQLYQNKQVKKIFLSGAHVDPLYPSQAEGMKNYLLKKGINNADIIVDDLGNNSYLTARNFIRWSEKNDLSSAVVVTSFYHVTRCKYIIKKLGFRNISGDHSEAFEFTDDLHGIVREFFAFYKYVWVY